MEGAGADFHVIGLKNDAPWRAQKFWKVRISP